MATNYTTKTAALKATKADINKIDAKKMLLNGKNILDYISDSEFNSYDTRDPQLKNDELDIWNTAISLSEEGHIEVKPKEHSYKTIPITTLHMFKNVVTIRNNEVFDGDNNHVMYWQTDGLTDGTYIFGLSDGAPVSNIVTFDSDMPSLTNGNNMFSYTPYLVSFNGDLSSLVEGEDMFHLSLFNSFTSDLSSLQNGNGMFAECENLTVFKCNNLDSLTDGVSMFAYSTINSFDMNLSSLQNGNGMFLCCPLATFNGDLSSLENGKQMFAYTNITSFDADLSSLQNGNEMFTGCSSLTSFTSPILSLISANNMFEDCKLDTQSVANIIHFIPQRDAKPTSTYDNGKIYIGIGITNTDAAKQAFAEECYCTDWAELNKEFDEKNWAVQWQFNGEATTYGLRDPRPSTAVYARLEEVIMPTEEEITAAKENGERIQIPHHEYTSQDGTKFYNIHWYHESNTNNEGYDYFESLEMATLAYSVIPKENIISTEE